MAQSGITVNQMCIDESEKLRVAKKLKWIVFKINDAEDEIEVEGTGETRDWETFREHLLNAKYAGTPSKPDGRSPGPRYAIYDFEWETANGEGTRGKLSFISWSPDVANIKPKMLYSSTKETLKRALPGISADDLQINDASELEENEVLKLVSKGTAALK